MTNQKPPTFSEFKKALKFLGIFAVLGSISAAYFGSKKGEERQAAMQTESNAVSWSQNNSSKKYQQVVTAANKPAYKGVAWTSPYKDVITLHKSENSMRCDLSLCRSMTPTERITPICRIKNDLLDLKSNSYTSDYDFQFTKLFDYIDVPLREVDKRFTIKPVGNGCGFFFKDMFIAQLNWVKNGLDKEEVLTDLKQSWSLAGYANKYNSLKYSLEHSGERSVYRFKSIDGELLISFYGGNVTSFYYHPELHRLVFSEIEGEKIVQKNKEKDDYEKELKSNAKKLKGNL